jgi:hypothetical protein
LFLGQVWSFLGHVSLVEQGTIHDRHISGHVVVNSMITDQVMIQRSVYIGRMMVAQAAGSRMLVDCW